MAQISRDDSDGWSEGQSGGPESKKQPLPRGMQLAISAARKGRGNVSPGTLVGAAWVNRGGQGTASYYARLGGPHAERRLLDRLKPRARSGTLYLTLEPCSHFGKTPPCLGRVIDARPKEVVIACVDPNPVVHGNGIRGLRDAGIPVRVGVGAVEAVAMNPAFFLFHAEKRSWIDLKIAASLDGKIATDRGESQWITGPAARRRVHRQRSTADAVVVGAGTLAADNPELTVRHVEGPEPSKIVIDSSLRSSPEAQVARAWRAGTQVAAKKLGQSPGKPLGNFWLAGGVYVRKPRLILATVRGHGNKLDAYRAAGWEVWELPAKGGHVSLRGLAKKSASEGLLHLFVEGGPGLAGGLLSEGLVDQFSLYTAPKILGGSQSWSGEFAASTLRSAREFEAVGTEVLGKDTLSTFRRQNAILELAQCSLDWSKN